jgi:hypothetical protein
MPIRVTCPGCSRTVEAPDAAAGKSGKCTTCGAVISVPADASPDVEPVAEDPQNSTPPPLPPELRAAAAQREYEERGPTPPPRGSKVEVDSNAADFVEGAARTAWARFNFRITWMGAVAGVVIAFSVVWLLDAFMLTRHMLEVKEAGEDTTVFQEIYELLAWWSALQMLCLGAALVALARRRSHSGNGAAEEQPPSD